MINFLHLNYIALDANADFTILWILASNFFEIDNLDSEESGVLLKIYFFLLVRISLYVSAEAPPES